ncbi:CueP family metal-binding protein [Paenibacillus polymyxa]|uniref:CueP family metal-binding protein n=1 Tax=Paenibacillus polymyxa TaxID=1406 RepID=UPI0004DEE0ED|nr:CueP family metal-binding protein [Paenibacillus polymyxa]
MKKGILVASGLVVAALGTYMITGNFQKEGADKLGTTDIKRLVHDFSAGKATAQSASINSSQLMVTGNDTRPMTYNLPDNEFFVSIAPYVDQTHPCATHSLTGCQGEIKNGAFNVTVHDIEGNVIMENAAMKSQPNGFIDLWLPRDKTYRISVNHEGKTAQTEFSTYEKDDTCITTMQLG